MTNSQIVLTGGDQHISLNFTQSASGWTMEATDSQGGGNCYSYLPSRPGPLTKYVEGVSKPGDLIQENRVYVTPQGVKIQTGTVLHEDGTGRGVAWRISPVAEKVEKFEKLLDAEQLVQGEQASVAFGADAATRERAAKNLKTARAKLYSLLGELSLEETRAYGEYRQRAKAQSK
jgi:hypothetical protein